MARQVPKHLRKAAKQAESQDWTIDWTRAGHMRFNPPRGMRDANGDLVAPVTFAGSGSDHRGDKNGIAALRRAGVDV